MNSNGNSSKSHRETLRARDLIWPSQFVYGATGRVCSECDSFGGHLVWCDKTK